MRTSLCCLVLACSVVCRLVNGMNAQGKELEHGGLSNARDAKCGEALTWSVSGGTLTITGSGEMYDFATTTIPWKESQFSLTSVVIDEGVTSIGENAFFLCRSITRVSIPSTVVSIGANAFQSCGSLSSVTIPAAVKSIGESAFDGCVAITFIDVEQNNSFYTSIDGVLFDLSCATLIKYPSRKTDLSYNIPNSVKSVVDMAFSYVRFLTSVSIPAGVESIGESPFFYCDDLTSILVDDSNTKFKSIDGVLFNNDGSILIRYPNGITNTSYIVPEGVTRIEEDAFSECSRLIRVDLPKTMTTIGKDSFNGCRNLVSINFPDGITTIGSQAFYYCQFSSITIPDSVTSIENRAFGYCSSLTSIFYQGSKSFSTNAFSHCNSLSTVCVSPDYQSPSFCEREVNSSATLCQEFQRLFNCCFKPAYIDNSFIQQERKNATEWRRQKTACVKYYCDNETGPESKNTTCDDPPPCYKSEGHCNATDGKCEYVRVDGWNELIKQENYCFELVCEGNKPTIKERDEVVQWKKLTNNCYEHFCDNESGCVSDHLCKDDDEICVEEQCMNKNELNDKHWIVEIELDGLRAEELDLAGIKSEISATSGIGVEQFEVGFELDHKGFVVRIIVYVTDEETANDVVSAMDKKPCSFGEKCFTRSVRAKAISGFFISSGYRILSNLMATILSLIILIVNS